MIYGQGKSFFEPKYKSIWKVKKFTSQVYKIRRQVWFKWFPVISQAMLFLEKFHIKLEKSNSNPKKVIENWENLTARICCEMIEYHSNCLKPWCPAEFLGHLWFCVGQILCQRVAGGDCVGNFSETFCLFKL